MQSENLLNINLAHAAEAAKRLDVELTDRFFADLEQEEISGGDVHAEIFVRASVGNIFNVQIKVKDAEQEDCDAPEMLYLEANNPCYDLSWQLYEIIETALPMQRVHAEGECNKDMVSYIMTADDEDNSFDDEEDE